MLEDLQKTGSVLRCGWGQTLQSSSCALCDSFIINIRKKTQTYSCYIMAEQLRGGGGGDWKENFPARWWKTFSHSAWVTESERKFWAVRESQKHCTSSSNHKSINRSLNLSINQSINHSNQSLKRETVERLLHNVRVAKIRSSLTWPSPTLVLNHHHQAGPKLGFWWLWSNFFFCWDNNQSIRVKIKNWHINLDLCSSSSRCV